jgi:hypothetical protein
MSYSNNMQVMNSDGVSAADRFFIGEPQIIPLPVKCVGQPKVKGMPVPTGQKWTDKHGNEHMQCNSMYLIKLHVEFF